MAIQLMEGLHWRDSARLARFFIFDAKAAFPVFLFLIHIKVWTLVVAVIMMLFFTILGRFGFSVEVFFRMLKCVISGPRKTAIPWWVN